MGNGHNGASTAILAVYLVSLDYTSLGSSAIPPRKTYMPDCVILTNPILPKAVLGRELRDRLFRFIPQNREVTQDARSLLAPGISIARDNPQRISPVDREQERAIGWRDLR